MIRGRPQAEDTREITKLKVTVLQNIGAIEETAKSVKKSARKNAVADKREMQRKCWNKQVSYF
jgi:hypothetical protein